MAKEKKQKTRAQVEAMQAKAVRFLRDVVGNDDKADDIEDMSLEDYAAKKHVVITGKNPGKRFAFTRSGAPQNWRPLHRSIAAAARRKGTRVDYEIESSGLPVYYIAGHRMSGEDALARLQNPGARKARLGSGQRFAALESKLASRPDIQSPRALAAAIGRRKYGKKKFQELAARGRRRENPEGKFREGDRVITTKKHGLTPRGRKGTFSAYGLQDPSEAIVHMPAGGSFIVPASILRKIRPGRRNPDVPLNEAVDLYQEFHGKAPSKVLQMQMSEAKRGTYTALGELWELCFKAPNGEKVKLGFEGNHVKLASSPDGNQLYLIGGDQVMSESLLKQFGAEGEKDFVDLGEAFSITYVTRKAFDQFRESAYVHKFGEEGGYRPQGFYNRLQRTIILAGGSYHIEAPGIIN